MPASRTHPSDSGDVEALTSSSPPVARPIEDADAAQQKPKFRQAQRECTADKRALLRAHNPPESLVADVGYEQGCECR